MISVMDGSSRNLWKGSESEDVVDDSLDEPCPFAGRQGNVICVDYGPELGFHIVVKLGLVQCRISDPGSHSFVQRMVARSLTPVMAWLASPDCVGRSGTAVHGSGTGGARPGSFVGDTPKRNHGFRSGD